MRGSNLSHTCTRKKTQLSTRRRTLLKVGVSCVKSDFRWKADSLTGFYLIELATEEKTLLALDPIRRIVPTTITRITANITAYSAMSCPSSPNHNLRRTCFILTSKSTSARWAEARPDNSRNSRTLLLVARLFLQLIQYFSGNGRDSNVPMIPRSSGFRNVTILAVVLLGRQGELRGYLIVLAIAENVLSAPDPIKRTVAKAIITIMLSITAYSATS
jgi:hypothetical protein